MRWMMSYKSRALAGALLLASTLWMPQSLAAHESSFAEYALDLSTMIWLQSAQVTQRLPYEAIYTNLEEYCTSSEIAKAQDKLEEFLELKSTKALLKYNNSMRKQIRFDETKQQLQKLSRRADGECARIYFLYQTLEVIQSQELNEPVLTLQHQGSNDPLLKSLTDQYIQDRLQGLLDDEILSQEDIARLQDKLIIEYVEHCASIHGAFHMLVWPDGRREVSKIVLKINECYEEYYLHNLRNYVDQILVHELGHYMYYFKDNSTDSFDSICRSGTSSRCALDEFVSRYAQTSKEEDYAESFAYWYLVVYPNSDPDKPHNFDPANRVARTRKTRKLDYFSKFV